MKNIILLYIYILPIMMLMIFKVFKMNVSSNFAYCEQFYYFTSIKKVLIELN